MAHGFVRVQHVSIGRWNRSVCWSWTRGTRFRAWVESDGVVVWADDGFDTLSRAFDEARRIADAFTITAEKGQRHRSWSEVVEEAGEAL